MMNTFNNLMVAIVLLTRPFASAAEGQEQDDGHGLHVTLGIVLICCFVVCVGVIGWRAEQRDQRQQHARIRSSSDVSNQFVRQNKIAQRQRQQHHQRQQERIRSSSSDVSSRVGRQNRLEPPRTDQQRREENNDLSMMADENVYPRLEPRLDQQERGQENKNGLTEEEVKANKRFEQFVTKFYFQTVPADKSNNNAEQRIRMPNTRPDQEIPTGNSSSSPPRSFEYGDSSLSEDVENQRPSQFERWVNSSAEKECCICLGNFCAGNTICFPATTRCNHVFHETCIQEWLMENNTYCPLCRVDLLGDQ